MAIVSGISTKDNNIIMEVKDHVSRLGRMGRQFIAMLVLTATAVLVMVYMVFGYSSGSVSGRQGIIDGVGTRISTVVIPRYNKTDSKSVTKMNVTSVDLVRKVRILCLILTMEKDINTKVDAVNRTWATRCDKHYYIIYSKQKRHDFLNIDVPDDRHNLIRKMQQVYIEIYKRHLHEFDFLLKADDDTYVIVDNLKFLLFHYDANEPGYLGFHFNKFVSRGYMSGGAGYVISNRGLRQLIELGYNKGVCEIRKRDDDPENSEDIETARCLEASGAKVWSSLDAEGRETFHPYPLETHLFGKLPEYVFSWAKNPVRNGKDCCSRYAISYHYVKPDAMLFLHHVLYETSVFGLNEEIKIHEPVFLTGTVT